MEKKVVELLLVLTPVILWWNQLLLETKCMVSSVGKRRAIGCPFTSCRPEELENLLKSLHISRDRISNIMQYYREKNVGVGIGEIAEGRKPVMSTSSLFIPTVKSRS